MASREDLQEWLLVGLRELGGGAPIVAICRWVWEHKESEIRASGDLFYTWQYDIRWAATKLRQSGRLKAADQSPLGVWELARSI